jgi:hypothetical protein
VLYVPQLRPGAVPICRGNSCQRRTAPTRQGKMASINQTPSKAPVLRAGHDGVPRGHVTEIQRARMLSAAVDAIEENGYARLNVALVIGRAKVSR